jgi:hypothetical protein
MLMSESAGLGKTDYDAEAVFDCLDLFLITTLTATIAATAIAAMTVISNINPGSNVTLYDGVGVGIEA